MNSKVFALFSGHVLYENDIARVMGYWDDNKKVFSVSELRLAPDVRQGADGGAK